MKIHLNKEKTNKKENGELSISNDKEIETEDEEEQPTKRAAKIPGSPMTKP